MPSLLVYCVIGYYRESSCCVKSNNAGSSEPLSHSSNERSVPKAEFAQAGVLIFSSWFSRCSVTGFGLIRVDRVVVRAGISFDSRFAALPGLLHDPS